MSEFKRCKLCNKAMRFVKGENGKTIPLDASAPVYEVRSNLLGEETAYRTGESIMVSHFSTCPHANEFSGSKK